MSGQVFSYLGNALVMRLHTTKLAQGQDDEITLFVFGEQRNAFIAI